MMMSCNDASTFSVARATNYIGIICVIVNETLMKSNTLRQTNIHQEESGPSHALTFVSMCSGDLARPGRLTRLDPTPSRTVDHPATTTTTPTTIPPLSSLTTTTGDPNSFHYHHQHHPSQSSVTATTTLFSSKYHHQHPNQPSLPL